MPLTMDIFNDDAFSLVELTNAISIVPNTYGRLQQLGLFPTQGVSTVGINVEFFEGVLNLLPSVPRGAPPTLGKAGKRKLRNFSAIHIPHEDVVHADEVQGLRAFGATSELEQVETVVNRKLMAMRAKHAITLEYLRCGALRGVIVDADGTTIANLFTEFGVTQKEVDFELNVETTDVGAKAREVLRHIEDNLKGEVMTEVRALCSAEFWDSFISHKKVEEAYKYYTTTAAQQPLREDLRKGFYFQGITWEEYRGTADYLNEDGTSTTRRFIPENDVRFFPMGTTQSFRTFFAPANFMETVNTPGLELYAKSAIDVDFQRWVKLHTQSNPLPLCLRPALLVRGVRF